MPANAAAVRADTGTDHPALTKPSWSPAGLSSPRSAVSHADRTGAQTQTDPGAPLAPADAFDPALDLIEDRPVGPPRWHLLLAHGAGLGPRAPFMEAITARLVGGGLRVLRFRFRHMARTEADGRKRPPDPEAVLIANWRRVIAQAGVPLERLLIGGKSMGGRIASLIADDTGVAGLVCLGYPFHPPARPQQQRTAHLARLRTPTLICQGERDPFGNRAEVAGYALAPTIRLAWIGDGEHSFKPRQGSGRTLEQNLDQAADAVLGFVAGLGRA